MAARLTAISFRLTAREHTVHVPSTRMELAGCIVSVFELLPALLALLGTCCRGGAACCGGPGGRARRRGGSGRGSSGRGSGGCSSRRCGSGGWSSGVGTVGRRRRDASLCRSPSRGRSRSRSRGRGRSRLRWGFHDNHATRPPTTFAADENPFLKTTPSAMEVSVGSRHAASNNHLWNQRCTLTFFFLRLRRRRQVADLV
mmetsp:Transcript_5179/g.11400  ORF Transcript_5179/g.11400 Transcript_5179/m.11400 type:complete len:200 (-) Transcript_5179:185-784(-)